ncbi:MAG: hypothetical protein KDB14_34545 [Planctomycetales bacterium]|nr:hypothetical protein [Planctomycetales bacterium]MCA9212427.1 hypothetical protein [Planctomycetales bacterium]
MNDQIIGWFFGILISSPLLAIAAVLLGKFGKLFLDFLGQFVKARRTAKRLARERALEQRAQEREERKTEECKSRILQILTPMREPLLAAGEFFTDILRKRRKVESLTKLSELFNASAMPYIEKALEMLRPLVSPSAYSALLEGGPLGTLFKLCEILQSPSKLHSLAESLGVREWLKCPHCGGVGSWGGYRELHGGAVSGRPLEIIHPGIRCESCRGTGQRR